MTPDTYRQLEAIFGKFNEAVVTLYSDLLDLYPNKQQPKILEALGLTLKNTAAIYRFVQDELFEAEQK